MALGSKAAFPHGSGIGGSLPTGGAQYQAAAGEGLTVENGRLDKE